MSKLNLVIVEDDAEIRETIQKYLAKDTELFESVNSYGSMDELLQSSSDFNNHLFLLDINLPGISGIEGIIPLKNKFSNIQILMISVMGDSESIFKSICAGASGYIDKDTPLPKIKEALIHVNEGGSPITPAIARKVFDYFQPSKKMTEELTAREKEVMQGIVDGLSYKLIADRLDISINSIRKYIRQIYSKLHINSKGELISKYRNLYN